MTELVPTKASPGLHHPNDPAWLRRLSPAGRIDPGCVPLSDDPNSVIHGGEDVAGPPWIGVEATPENTVTGSLPQWPLTTNPLRWSWAEGRPTRESAGGRDEPPPRG